MGRLSTPQGGRTIEDYKGKVVVITGGTSGLGYALADLLGAQGARIIILARAEAALEKTMLFVCERTHSNEPTGNKQVVAHRIARMRGRGRKVLRLRFRSSRHGR